MKRTLSIILSLALALTLIPFANATVGETDEGTSMNVLVDEKTPDEGVAITRVAVVVVNSTEFTGEVNDGTRYGAHARVAHSDTCWKYVSYGGNYDDTAVDSYAEVKFNNNAQRIAIGKCYTSSNEFFAKSGAWLHIYELI